MSANLPQVYFLPAPPPSPRPLWTLGSIPLPHPQLSCLYLVLPEPWIWSIPLPVTALHPNLTTIPIPPSEPPVRPPCLRSTRFHIATQSLALPFPLHQTLTTYYGCVNIQQSHPPPPPLLPLETFTHPFSTISTLRDSHQLSEILGRRRTSRQRSSKDSMYLPILWMLTPSAGRSCRKGWAAASVSSSARPKPSSYWY